MNAPNRPDVPRRISRGAGAGVPPSSVHALPTHPPERGPAHAPPPRRSAAPPPTRTPISWRAVVLAVVLVLALAVVLPSLRAYARQNARLAELTAQVDSARTEVTDLEAELARWEDPEYVVAQARARLFYVMPGETAYRVVDPETVPGDDEPNDGPEVLPVREAETWYVDLWGSFVNPTNGPGTP